VKRGVKKGKRTGDGKRKAGSSSKKNLTANVDNTLLEKIKRVRCEDMRGKVGQCSI
jgi:hypothetical protein